MVRPFGDDFPEINHDSQGSGEQRSVVIKFTQISRYDYNILLTTTINHHGKTINQYMVSGSMPNY